MNAYVVRMNEEREYVEPVMDDGSGPRIPYLPIAPVVADTPAQAKRLFLREFTHRSRSGVYTDDWTSLRVRLLARDVDGKPGVDETNEALWLRVHEVDDHGGKPCDCPIEDDYARP